MKKVELNDQTYSEFFRQLAMLLRSGLRLDDACSVLASEEMEKDQKEIFASVAAALESGKFLHEALAETGCFPSHVIALIQTAENSGRTEEVLTALADSYENKSRLRRSLINAITYPLILLAIMLVIVVVLLSKVFPIFNEVYASLGSSLSGMAAVLLKLGRLIGASLPYLGMAGGVALLVVAGILLVPGWKRGVKRLFTGYFGDCGFLRQSNNAFFIQNLAMILSSGTPLEQSLHLTDDLLTESRGFRRRCQAATKRIGDGENYPEVLRDLGFIDLPAYRMLSIGMKTGNADAVMAHLAGQMTAASEEAMEARISRIEMTLVIVMSVLVGAILFSAMLPLINIMKAFG